MRHRIVVDMYIAITKVQLFPDLTPKNFEKKKGRKEINSQETVQKYTTR